MRRTWMLIGLVLAGCGVTTVDGGEGVGDTADELTAQTITFGTSGITAPALKKGKKVQVAYDPARLGDCRGDDNGQPAWSITGYWRLNGGAVGSFEAGGYSPSHGTQKPVFTVSANGDLELWFQVTNKWGCTAWDSNGGQNYHFEVGAKPATIDFKADWTVVQGGTLKAGSPLTVTYALARLPHCRQTYNGLQTWDVVMSYRFDGGAVTDVSVTRTPSNYERVAAPATVAVPTGAHDLEVWFHNSDRAGCSEWDSNYAQNFHFAVN